MPALKRSIVRAPQPLSATRHGLVVAALLLGTLAAGCDEDAIVVDSTSDGGSGSLRAAIDAANARTDEAVRIEIAAGTYELTRCAGDDTNGGGDLDITASVPVSLVGTGRVVIQQTCAGERVLERHGSSVLSVSGVTISGGSTSADGGGIRGQNVNLAQVTVTGNRATNGGGVAAQTLAAHGVTITENTASERGGGVYVSAQATVAGSTIGSNVAGSGGGIVVDGALQISESRVTANRAERLHPYLPSVGAPTSAGGIRARTLQGDRITVDNNALRQCTVYYDRLIPTGEANGAGIWANTVSLTNSTITDNKAPSCGGFGFSPVAGVAIRAASVTLEHVTIADNSEGPAITTESLVSHRSLIVGPHGGALCNGVVQSDSSYNRLGDGSCNLYGPGDTQDTLILLAPLANNGGAVPTRVPNLSSVLVDQIPLADCPLKVDARGTPRPQGAACDIGAVEAQVPAGFGPADLSVAFVNPPSSVTAGESTSWQLEVMNKGPNVQAAVVVIERPSAVFVDSLTASGGGACTRSTPMICMFPQLAAGVRESVTISGRMVGPASFLDFRARLFERGLTAPFTDDEAQVRTPVRVDATLRMQVAFVAEQVEVRLFNDGPFQAMGTEEDPVRVTFRPAAGVNVSYPEYKFTGLFTKETYPLGYANFTLTFDGAPPAQLGTVEVDPGPNRLSGPAVVPIVYRARPDLRVAVWRAPGVAPVGASIPVTVEVENVGPGPALDAMIDLDLLTEAIWTPPPTGSVEATTNGYEWEIPLLASGSTVQLQGTIAGRAEPTWLDAESEAYGDPERFNNGMRVEVTAAPNGTADLEVTLLDMTGAGPYYVRALITNKGPAALETATFDDIEVFFHDWDWTVPYGSTAAVLRSSAPWYCGSDRCSLQATMPAGSTHLFEFQAGSGEPIPGFRVSISGGIGAPDPDPRNNVGAVAR